jgi:hypothetical protein
VWHVKHLVFHGAVILLIGFLCGAPLGRAIVRKKPEETVRAWRVAHTSLVGGGMLLLVLAATVSRLMMDLWSMVAMVAAFVVGGYAFVVSLPLSAWSGQRGLSAAAPVLNRVVYAFNVVGVLALLAGGALLVMGAYEAL